MFNFFKTFFILTLLKKNKKKFFFLLSCILLIVLTIYFTDDLVNYIDKEDKKVVFIVKWMIISLLSISSLITIRFIFKTNIGIGSTSTFPIKKENNKTSENKNQNTDIHRERVKSKKTFQSKGESIIEKYSSKNVQNI